MDKSIKKAEKKLEYLSQDPEARKLYEARENAKIEYNSDIDLATKKGEEKGLAKGKMETVVKALKRDLDVEVICDITGLTMEEVLKIKEDLEKWNLS